LRTDGRTDRHNEANSRFSQFHERAQKYGLCSKHTKPVYELYYDQQIYILSVASQSAGGQYRQSDRRRSAKLVPTLAGRGVLRGQRHDPHGR
jgi:hypothetical protein